MAELTVQSLAEKLSYADIPRPFKNPHYVSRLGSRTATSSTTTVKKNAKQILVLERERVSGGDGFLSSAQMLAKARGEPIEVGKKKKGGGGAPSSSNGGQFVSGSNSHGHSGAGGKKGSGGMQNVLKGRMKKALEKAAADAHERGEEVPPMLNPGTAAAGGAGTGAETGATTPATTAAGLESGLTTGQATPAESDEDVSMDAAPQADGNGDINGNVKGEEKYVITEADIMPKGEVFTYHTPTAPPSLLPPKKYCDITGLPAAYTDPRTKLRYKGLDVWHVVRGLGPGSDQAYLALRGAQTSLK